ncbi:MAG: CHAT domain-containing protein [Segetibacter sp.]
MNDTVAYILGITPSNTQLLKLSRDNFNSAQLINFLQKCSSEPTSNNDYLSFSSLSHSLYKLLFQPLKIPQGRVIICPDNFLIPFDALCADNTGNNFLINDYIFSYVYSASFLFKKYNSSLPNGDFIGFAPVSFNAYSFIADLKQSGDALKQSAKHYNNSKLLTNNNASRHNFISAVSGYTIVNVFSHALADTTENEPLLYMYDSIVRLSDLQLLHNPATKLVVLSACQTNVGRSAKGEGILSLARGFASAGIPSVAATLWQADEESIYAISEKFHEYLSKGMPKDEALQKAKLYFIRNGFNKKTSAYYWANMILVGNQEPVKLSEDHQIWWWAAGIFFIIALILLIVQFFKKH